MIGREGLLLAELSACEKGVPVDAGCLGGKVGALPLGGRVLEVLTLLARQVRLGDLHFEIIDPLRLALGIGNAGLGQELSHIGAVLAAQLRHLGIVRQVIFALGHAEPALEDIGHHRRAGQRLGDEQAEQVLGLEVGGVERIDVGANLLAEHAGQALHVADPGEAIQVGLDRLEARGVDRRGIEVSAVEVADAAFVAARRRGRAQDPGDEFAKLRLGLVVGDVEAAYARTVSRNLGCLEPGAVGEEVEVIARLDAAIHHCRVDAQCGGCRSSRIGRRFGDGGDERGRGDAQEKRCQQLSVDHSAIPIGRRRATRPAPLGDGAV